MLNFVLSAPATVVAFLTEHLTLLTASAAVLAAAALLGRVAFQLAADRRPAPRHRPLAIPAAPIPAAPISAPPAPPVEAAPFDPLDARTPLDDVEAFLRSLSTAAAVDRREDDTRDLETVR